MNTWGVAFDGYKSEFVREVAGSVKEKANIEIGKSRRYEKKKLDYWCKQRPGAGRDTILRAFKKEKLNDYQIEAKYGITRRYVRHILQLYGLIQAEAQKGMKAVVIIHESGKVYEYDSVADAREKFGLKQTAFRKHLKKKGNVDFFNGMKALFKNDYEQFGMKS